LLDQRVRRALRPGASAVTATDVVLALSTPEGGGSVASRLGRTTAKLARRTRPVRGIAGRTPTGLALRFGPGLVDAVTANLRGIDAAAAHLVTRARDQRIEPDPDRLRAVVVQALVGAPIDPDADVDHAQLARLWLSDAGRRLAPFGLDRVRALARGRTPEAVAASLGTVDVRRLRP
ncbi:MAG TPA: hypothetical protein VFU14_18200, partial [Acidimicrobiales bacterium]|nr:hypothetical protein [Acidimicrobiales bacterium]